MDFTDIYQEKKRKKKKYKFASTPVPCGKYFEKRHILNITVLKCSLKIVSSINPFFAKLLSKCC